MSANASFAVVPYGHDPIALVAEHLFGRFRAAAPVYSDFVVLVPAFEAVPYARRLLLSHAVRHGHAALLPPYIGTLDAWLNTHAGGIAPLAPVAQEALLARALGADYRSTPSMRWHFVDSALRLFDALDANADPFGASPDAFAQRVRTAYGSAEPDLTALGDEARRAHRLWQHWREYVRDTGMTRAHWRERLLAEIGATLTPAHVFIVAPLRLTQAERAWIDRLAANGAVSVFLHGQVGTAAAYHPDRVLTRLAASLNVDSGEHTAMDELARFIDSAYLPPAADTADFATRARAFARAVPQSPAQGRCQIFAARNLSQQAHAIELQVRRWWLAGKRDIAVVSLDRKLARRVRALLERAQLPLYDGAGWPLSTASAATLLARWLDTVARDFPFPLLAEVLSSPYLNLDTPGVQGVHTRKELLGVFAQALARTRVRGGLAAYMSLLNTAAPSMDARLGANSGAQLRELLMRVRSAAAPLLPLLKSAHDAATFAARLQESLARLGVAENYLADAAGFEVLAELQGLHQAAGAAAMNLHWEEWRAWLNHRLEQRRFQPAAAPQHIQLLTPAQTRAQRFDAVVIAGTSSDALAGTDAAIPFFNDSVRAQLGLTTTIDQRNEQLYDFRRLVAASDSVLITYPLADESARPLSASPWVERLQTFHELAYGDDLGAHEVAALAELPPTWIAAHEPVAALPTESTQPAPAVPPGLLPTQLSAAGYQQLLDCPYQYFVTRTLRVQAREDLMRDLAKADYGERIHRILQAFHVGHSGLPGPFPEPLTAQNEAQARVLLRTIAEATFAGDVKESFYAYAWLHRWYEMEDAYLAWQRERAQAWQLHSGELQLQTRWHDMVLLGRVDRIERNADGEFAILDYKTGALPGGDALASGESSQLAFYALLAQTLGPVREVRLLGLDRRIRYSSVLADDTLTAQVAGVRERIVSMMTALRAGAPLPALGQEATCRHCNVRALCRKHWWDAAGSAL